MLLFGPKNDDFVGPNSKYPKCVIFLRFTPIRQNYKRVFAFLKMGGFFWIFPRFIPVFDHVNRFTMVMLRAGGGGGCIYGCSHLGEGVFIFGAGLPN